MSTTKLAVKFSDWVSLQLCCHVHGVWKDTEACGVEVVVSIEAISWNHDQDCKLIMDFVAGEHRWTLDHTSGLLTFIIAPWIGSNCGEKRTILDLDLLETVALTHSSKDWCGRDHCMEPRLRGSSLEDFSEWNCRQVDCHLATKADTWLLAFQEEVGQLLPLPWYYLTGSRMFFCEATFVKLPITNRGPRQNCTSFLPGTCSINSESSLPLLRRVKYVAIFGKPEQSTTGLEPQKKVSWPLALPFSSSCKWKSVSPSFLGDFCQNHWIAILAGPSQSQASD